MRDIDSELKTFEESLKHYSEGDPTLEKHMSGEVKLLQDVTVFIPAGEVDPDQLHWVTKHLDNELRVCNVGWVKGGVTLDNMHLIDFFLTDFIVGTELIRARLIENKMPKETIVEYSGGDLSLY